MHPAQQAFHDSIRQAMTNAVNLGDATEAAQGIQELAQSLRLSNSGQWASQPGRPQMFAFAAGPDGRPISLGQQRNDNPFIPQGPSQDTQRGVDGNSDDESMPPLLTDDNESDDYDDDEADARAQGASAAQHSWQGEHARQAPSQPRSIITTPLQHRQEELESHPAGSSIDDIDIELPLLQDEYASSEDALEGTSGVDEDMPSLLNDELASSGSEHASNGRDAPRGSTRGRALRSPTAPEDMQAQPDSAASSMTARSMLDPAQACGMENLPNKRLKREGDPWTDSPQVSADSPTEDKSPEGAEPLPGSRVSLQQTDRPFGGPLTWARRGAGALTSWALGMAGLR